MSALFCWRCNISIRLSPRSDWWCPPFSAGHAACLFISQVCHFWCPPLSVGHAAFLFMCLPGLSLVVSALFRWPCSISILLSARSVTGVSLSIGHEAFLFICLPGPLLLVSALFRWPCIISIHHLSPRSVTCGVRPFPLAMQHFYSFVSQVCHCWCPPFSAGFSAGHVAFLFICLPHLSLLVSALFRWPCSISIRLSPM